MATIEEIKSSANISDIIGKYVKLKKTGPDHKGLCPFHNEKTPSFTVSDTKGIYKCFGCGKSGDLYAFLMEHEKLTFIEAAKKVAEILGLEIDNQVKEYTKPVARLETISKKYIDWFEKRGISNNTIIRFGITEANEWMPQFKQETAVLCFNYYRDAQLVNIKFRGPQKAFKLEKGAELIFYNLDSIKDESEIYIVEGEIDAMSLYEAGIYNVVSVPNGAGIGNLQLSYLDNCYQYFTGANKIVIFTDKDAPGFALREELARRLGKERCYKVFIPEDCKDANDVLIKHGKAGLSEVCANAMQWPIEGVFTLDELYDEVADYYENGYPKGCDTKIPGLDELITFEPGQITTITGVPGHGKSEFTDLIMTRLAQNHSWVWGVCSFENRPGFHITKLLEKITGKAFDFRKDPMNRISILGFQNAIMIVDKYFNFLKLNEIDVTIDGILDKAKELVLRKGLNGLIIDPWNYIEHKLTNGQTETAYISETLTKIKSFAIKTGVHVFLIAHPAKMQKDKDTKQPDIPNLYSISGSAHFFNKTDNGICVYRDQNRGVVDVYVQKIRNSWAGKVGFCTFTYDTLTRQYI